MDTKERPAHADTEQVAVDELLRTLRSTTDPDLFECTWIELLGVTSRLRKSEREVLYKEVLKRAKALSSWSIIYQISSALLSLYKVNPPTDEVYQLQKEVDRLRLMALVEHGYELGKILWSRDAMRAIRMIMVARDQCRQITLQYPDYLPAYELLARTYRECGEPFLADKVIADFHHAQNM